MISFQPLHEQPVYKVFFLGGGGGLDGAPGLGIENVAPDNPG